MRAVFVLIALIALSPLACQRSAPADQAPEAPPGPPVFVRKDGAQIYAGLGRPLPAQPRAKEATCLASLAQAKLLADEPDARVQRRARERRVACRTFLAETWTKRAEAAEGEGRAEPCLNARAQIRHLRKDAPKAADGLAAGVDRVCSQVR